MPSIIWCDRVQHVVEESRDEVANVIHAVLDPAADPNVYIPRGFFYVTPYGGGNQVCLNAAKVSSIEAAKGSGV